jgi:hypothetical protein
VGPGSHQLANTLHRAMYFILDLLMHRDVESMREDANRHHGHALRLLDLLLDDPRAGDGSAGRWAVLAPQVVARPRGRPVT